MEEESHEIHRSRCKVDRSKRQHVAKRQTSEREDIQATHKGTHSIKKHVVTESATSSKRKYKVSEGTHLLGVFDRRGENVSQKRHGSSRGLTKGKTVQRIRRRSHASVSGDDATCENVSNSLSTKCSAGSRLDNKKRHYNVPQWVSAAVSARQEAISKAAAVAAARVARSAISHLTMAVVGEECVKEEDRCTFVKREQRKGDRSSDGFLLQTLDLRGRGICSSDDLGGLKNLQRLDISDNKLGDLGFLKYNFSLRHLNAARNMIKSLDGTMNNLTNLAVLDLSGNALTSLDELNNLPALKTLIVTGNSINMAILFAGSVRYGRYLVGLECLIMSKNKISEFEKPIQPLTRLRKLSLSDNLLRRFPFSGQFPALSELRLTGNKLQEVGTGVICMPSLTILDMGRNLLSKLESVKALSNHRKVAQINFLGNPLCDTDADELRNFCLNSLPSLRVFNTKPLQPKMPSKVKQFLRTVTTSNVARPTQCVSPKGQLRSISSAKTAVVYSPSNGMHVDDERHCKQPDLGKSKTAVSLKASPYISTGDPVQSKMSKKSIQKVSGKSVLDMKQQGQDIPSNPSPQIDTGTSGATVLKRHACSRDGFDLSPFDKGDLGGQDKKRHRSNSRKHATGVKLTHVYSKNAPTDGKCNVECLNYDHSGGSADTSPVCGVLERSPFVLELSQLRQDSASAKVISEWEE